MKKLLLYFTFKWPGCNDMTTIENKIDDFFEQTEQSVHSITEGSDAHLDVILSITIPLHRLAQDFNELNKYLLLQLDQLTDEAIVEEILPRMNQLNKACATLIGSIRTSFLYRDVRSALKQYSREYEHFREIWHDLQHIRLNKDNELDNLQTKTNQKKQ